MAIHNTRGKEGEKIARKYLESKGYTILEQNYQTKRAEIDIIARHNNELVLVEVRTKHHEQYGTPEDTIDYWKRMRLQRNAIGYVHRMKYKGPYRIDAICLVVDPNRGLKRIHHYENIIEG